MMNLFKQNAHEFVPQIPTSEWEWMFLVRHHGLPSRLLDWTESPLIGLFFTVPENSRPKGRKVDGVLWCLLPSRLNESALQWPTNSNALPMLTDKPEEYSLAENEAVLNYLPSRVRQLQAGSAKVPLPAAGLSVRTTRRIQAQMGVFTVHHADKMALEAVGDGTHIWRFIIPSKCQEKIVDELRRIKITRSSVFPELDNVAKDAGEAVGGE